MSTQTSPVIEFRCNRCWQTNQVGLDSEGRTSKCLHCQADNIVPEASPERVREEQASASSPATNPYAPTGMNAMSDAELMRLVQAENSKSANGQLNLSGFADASIVSRFFANLVDTFYMLAACALGVVAIFAAASIGIVEIPEGPQNRIDPTPIIIFAFFPFVASIVQWNLIATRGQTIGKLVLSIRMITMDGRLPGFVHGVILRNWVRALLGAFIPFFGLIDILFVFGNAHRCLHDYIAGTRVVQV